MPTLPRFLPRAPIAAAALVALLAVPATGQAPAQAPVDGTERDAREAPGERLVPLPVQAKGMPKLEVTMTPVELAPPGGVAGVCPEEEVTYANPAIFDDGGDVFAQAGFVEGESVAATFTVPAEDVPLRIDLLEWVVAAQSLSVQTVTEWTVIVWEGLPTTGTIEAIFSSDGKILPHIIAGPGANIGVNVQVSVDPGDPEQIIIDTPTFTVGFRIDAHHNPPVAGCLCVPGLPIFGSIEAACCPPDPNSNVFPATETNGVDQPANNWLDAADCRFSDCTAAGGWRRFSELGLFQPSGDWVISATYSPFFCTTDPGACCFSFDPCMEMTALDCDAAFGFFQGEGVLCADVQCLGACCIDPGCSLEVEELCLQVGGEYQGDGTTCDGGACPQAQEACCFDGGGCVDLTPDDCLLAAGSPHGGGTSCASPGFICFPACCLPDGSCLDGQSPADCATAGGVTQGGETCATVSCPQPTGACCLTNGNCLELTETDCGQIPSSSWAGAATTCPDDCGTCDEDCDGSLDGLINVADLLAALGDWGAAGGLCDFDGEPGVSVGELLAILGLWGGCP